MKHILMKFSKNITIAEFFNETAYVLQSHGVPPAGRHEGVLLAEGSRLLSIKQKNPQLQFTDIVICGLYV